MLKLTAVILSAFIGISNSFMAYMDYRAITDATSNQYLLQSIAYTDEATGIRMVDDLYMIAVGTYFGYTGDVLTVTLDDGTHIDCIVGDTKAEAINDRYHPVNEELGCVIEFIVDEEKIPDEVKRLGTYDFGEVYEITRWRYE